LRIGEVKAGLAAAGITVRGAADHPLPH